MIYVTIDSVVHTERKEFPTSQDFVKWILTTFGGADLVFRQDQNVRVYWHRISQTFILARGTM